MKKVSDILSGRKLFITTSDNSVYDAVRYMAENNIGILPVLDNKKLVGVFSERDLVKRVIAKDLHIKETKISDVMSTNLILADINESYSACVKKMQESNIRHILVIDNEKLTGVISMRDLLELDIIVYKETVEVLNNYIYSK